MKHLFLALSIVLILASCDNGDADDETSKTNPLIGTWESITEAGIETFTFLENNKVTTIYEDLLHPDAVPHTISGVYQHYDTVIIFRMENGLKFFVDYSISSNKLTMTFSHNNYTAIYTKIN